MTRTVDLRELAVDRGPTSAVVAPKSRYVSRIVLPAGLLLGFCALIGWAAREAWLPRKPVTVVPVLVSRAEVRQEGTPLFKAAGWIEPRPTAIRVAGLAAGAVEELHVVEDQRVEAGELIATLVDDDAELARRRAAAELAVRRAALDQAEARLEAARTRLETPVHLEAQVAAAETELAAVVTRLATLPARIDKAQAELVYARRQLGRMQDLVKRDAVEQNRVDLAERDASVASAMIEELEQTQTKLENEREALRRRVEALRELLRLKADEKQALGEAQGEVDSAQAAVAQAEAALAEAELRLERMTIRAPVSGRILDLVAEPGSRVMLDLTGPDRNRDGATVVTMYRPDQLQVRVDVRFEDLLQVVPGQPVLVESPALAEPLRGEALFLTSIADIQKNTLEVKVGLDDPPEVLKPEMLVDATFLAPPRAAPEQPSEEHRLYVPVELVDRGENGAHVWLADLSVGIARRQRVEVGGSLAAGLVEITSGLDEGSRLISAGRAGLQDGDRIEVTGEDESLGSDSAAAVVAGKE